MAKHSQKATKRAVGNKRDVEPPSSPTTYNRSRKRATAKVTSITADGFWLRVSGTDYFLSFDNFPWFRYASDDDIRIVSVFHSDPDDEGEFSVNWTMLDVLLGTNHILHIAQNPVKLPHPVAYPAVKGKLANRSKDTAVKEKQYEIEAVFSFKGKITVTAESEKQARQFVKEHCRMQLAAAVVDVHVPFTEIAWEFPFRVGTR